MKIGHEIARLRFEKNISQKQLAKEINVSAGVVGMWETNKRTPSLEVFVNIIDYFGVNADLLLKEDRKIKISPDNNFYMPASLSEDSSKLLEAFEKLNEDNKDIIRGKIKEYLKEQRLEEKEEKRENLMKKNEAG